VADVDQEEALEEPGVPVEDVQGAVADARGAVHKEQTTGHDGWEAHDASMGSLVGSEMVGAEREGKCGCLTEAEGDAFAGDGVDGTGGIADKSNVGGGDALERVPEGDGTARGIAWMSGCEMALECWEVTQGFAGRGCFVACDEGDADFGGGDGRDVGLAVIAPIDFYEVAPGRGGVMLADSDAARIECARVESRNGGYAGVVAVGTDEIAGAKGLGVGVDDGSVVIDCEAAKGVFPMEANAEAGCTIQQELMEGCAWDAASRACGKGALDSGVVVRRGIADEADAVQGSGFGWKEIASEIEAEGVERFKSTGQKAFAAGFIDGRFPGVDDFDVQALFGRGDGASQAGGTTADDENVRLRCQGARKHRGRHVFLEYDAANNREEEGLQANDRQMMQI
jgi:hypothetical protein